jgi:hypothetical protein
MHWGVNEAANSPETVLEVRDYLKHPVHFFAECQAVNAFEGAPPTGGRGNFLTTQGFTWPAPAQARTYDFYNDDSPFAQIDGVFQSVGGSEPAYSLPVGGAYTVGGVVMITEAGTPEGDSDVWMTGFLDGACPPLPTASAATTTARSATSAVTSTRPVCRFRGTRRRKGRGSS